MPLKKNGRVIPWRENPVILQSIEVAMAAWSEARAPSVQLRIVNEWREEKGYSPISMRTLNEYKQHAKELFAERAGLSADERIHEHNLRHLHLLRQLNEDIDAIKDTTNDWKAIAILEGVKQRVIAEMPKYDGTTIIQVQQTIEHRSDNEEASILISVLTQRFGEAGVADALADVRKLLAAPKGDVVEAEYTVKDNAAHS